MTANYAIKGTAVKIQHSSEPSAAAVSYFGCWAPKSTPAKSRKIVQLNFPNSLSVIDSVSKRGYMQGSIWGVTHRIQQIASVGTPKALIPAPKPRYSPYTPL